MHYAATLPGDPASQATVALAVRKAAIVGLLARGKRSAAAASAVAAGLDGMTPLHLAAGAGLAEVAEALLCLGARADVADQARAWHL
jgi:hypothetical protein